MLAFHVDAAFSTGLSKNDGPCGLHPSAESRTPDGARLVGAVQSAFELPAESCQGEAWWRTAEELLVMRQNAVEKSSFYVEMVYVQVEFVSDGQQSANSGRLRHW